MALEGKTLPDWIRRWLQFSTVVCLYDSLFILLRPHSLPGGSLENVFYGFRSYVAVDELYSNMEDSFIYAYNLQNIAEIAINVTCLVYNARQCKHTIPLAFAVCVMTFWKSVTYLGVYWNMEFRKGNTILQEVTTVYCLRGVWLLVPFLCIIRLWEDVCGGDTYTASRRTLCKATPGAMKSLHQVP